MNKPPRNFIHRLSVSEHQWLKYVEETRDVFSQFPFAQPLLWGIFYHFYKNPEKRLHIPLLWSARVIRRQILGKTRIPKTKPDILFWVPREQDRLIKHIVALYKTFTDLGISSFFLGTEEAYKNPDLQNIPGLILAKKLHKVKKEQWNSFVNKLSTTQKIFHGLTLRDLGTLPEKVIGYNYEIQKVLSQLVPKALIIAEELLVSSHVLCLVAKRLGIKVFVLQHGAVNGYFMPVNSDYFITWGSISTHHMQQLGLSNDRILTLGSPGHDRFAQIDRSSARVELLKTLSLPDRPTFVFFSNGNDPVRNTYEALEACKDWLYSAARLLKRQYNIVIKLHPDENGELYLDADNNITIFKNECDVLSSIAGSDIIGSLCSTVLSEALIFNIPAFQFLGDGWPELVDNWRWLIAHRIKDGQSLVKKLVAVSNNDRNIRNVDTSIYFANQGCAAENVSKTIAKLAGCLD